MYLNKLKNGQDFIQTYRYDIKNLDLDKKSKLELLYFFNTTCRDTFNKYFRAWDSLSDDLDLLEEKITSLSIIGQTFFGEILKEKANQLGWEQAILDYSSKYSLSDGETLNYEIELNSQMKPVFVIEYNKKIDTKRPIAKAFDSMLIGELSFNQNEPIFYSYIAAIYNQRKIVQNAYIIKQISKL
jgi:hypothetical protein